MAIGIPYKLFWELNPRKIKPFYEAHKIKNKELDQEMWVMGAYIHNAVLSAVEKNLAGSKAKTSYIERPFLQQTEIEKNETETAKEENLKKVKAVFQSLEIMKANFELSKKGNEQ